MDRHKLVLVIHTIKYLRLKQVYYRIYYFIRNRLFKKEYKKKLQREISPLKWDNIIFESNAYLTKNKFRFLNIHHDFYDKIDWNFSEHGKLWTYNLNYFEFLNQEKITYKDGLFLIRDYVKENILLKDGKEPYPISLRGVNWIKFLSKNKILDDDINQELYNHYQILLNNLEYHLLGNHLLENGFSLLFGAYYFKDQILYNKAKYILKEELNEQILNDGGHFELSPMYHQIILYRVLDCINLLKLNSWKKDELLDYLNGKAQKMLSWLQEISFENGDIPMVNDSAFGIAPTSTQLFNYAERISMKWEKTTLSDSGYRMIKNNRYELFFDVGAVGSNYQPGHAHSDTFNFLLYLDKKPFIVEVGTSTYEKNELRLCERSTESHNTIKVNNTNQTQVWDSFRVAERAKIINLKEEANKVVATHNGYQNMGVFQERTFLISENKINISDKIKSKKPIINSEAFIHFHPKVGGFEIRKNHIFFKDFSCKISFDGDNISLVKEKYKYALGFNKLIDAQMIKVRFNKYLKTNIET